MSIKSVLFRKDQNNQSKHTKRIRNSFLAASLVVFNVFSPIALIVSNPATTLAARTTTSATVGGGTSVSVAPGATISTAVTGTLTSGDDWDATEWRISTTPPGTTTCANTPDHGSNGTYTETFNITAPVTPGTYNAYFRISGNSNCSSQPGTLITLTNAVTVLPPSQADLVVTKTNNTSNTTTTGTAFTWTLTVTNNGNASATFDNQDILQDDLPNSNMTYTNTSNIPVQTTGGVTGDIDCDVASNTLDCDDNNNGSVVVIPAGGSFSVNVTATAEAVGSYTNPRNNGICRVDPDAVIAESNEANNDCIANTVTANVNTGTANPVLPQACGLDIALVLDNSTSIDANEMTTMKAAVTAFTNAFAGTPTQFSVTSFATSATVLSGFTTNIPAVNAAINGIPVGGGFTNWEDGLLKAQSTFDPRPSVPNLVIFASDGNPNTVYGGSGGGATESAAVSAAATVANSLKTGGTRMLALGIGSGLNVNNMKAISGSNVDTGSVLTSDVITSDFSTLADDLADFAAQTCGGTITTTKLIDQDGNLQTTNDRLPAEGWSFDVDGNPSNPAATQTDDNGQTPAVDVDPGTYSVTEGSQSGYAILYASCNGATNNGSLQDNTVSGLVVSANDIVSCTFINSPMPTLTLLKYVTNNNGGTKNANDFQGKIDGNDVDWGTGVTLAAGNHTASEVSLPTYDASNWGGDCAADGTITLGLGQNATCTITNDDKAPELTLIKALGFTYGSGNLIGDWNLTATGTGQSPTNLSGATGTAGATSGADFKADTYTLGETGPSGYTSSWECVGGNSVVNATIAISLGQNVTCTVTNTGIQPKITLYKVIDGNQYGDSATVDDFGLTIGGDAATSGTTYGKDVGSYAINEAGLEGYEFVEIKGDEECPTKLGDTVTLELGDDITCTIHNKAKQPKLIVKKHVINDNNGTSTAGSFTMTVTGTNVSDSEFPGEENGTEIYLNEGTYSVDELDNSAYAKSIGANCSGSIAVGEVKTCTITNDDIQPKITLVKVIENDEQYGDDAVVNDFGLTIDGNTVDSGVAYGKDAGYYQISENGLDGYEFVNISGHERCPETLNGSVQLFVGDDITCTIQNRAIQPKLMIKKTVENDNSGNKEADDFTITVSGTNVSDNEFPGTSDYTTIYLDEGTYSVDEIADAGYIKTLSEDCSGTIALGETKYCTVTNDDVTNPAIGVIKYGPANAYEGDQITYWFWVTNTGDTTLYNVNVSDDIADNEVCDSTTLAKGESTWCSASYTIPSQQEADVTNTVTACGYEYANEIKSVDSIVIDETPQQPVCGTDSHTLDVLHPSIAVVKSGPSAASAGQKVTYTFTVTNTGDIELSSLTVEDDIAGAGTYVSGDTNEDSILEPGETWVYSADYVIPSNQTKDVVNTVTVCGYEWFYQEGEEYLLSRQIVDGEDDIVTPKKPVCSTDSHTLSIPQVLGASTTAPKPTVLANTGSGINVAQLIAPLFLLGATLGLAIASRRANKTSTK